MGDTDDRFAGRCRVCNRLPGEYREPDLTTHLEQVHQVSTPVDEVRAILAYAHRPTGRTARRAVEAVLDRHQPLTNLVGVAFCGECGSQVWPCRTVTGVLTAFDVPPLPSPSPGPHAPPPTQEAPAPLDGRLTDAVDYGQAHALGLPEVGEAGEPAPPTVDSLQRLIEDALCAGGEELHDVHVTHAHNAEHVVAVVAPLLAAKRDEVDDWTRRAAEIDDLLAASRARVAELTRERDEQRELLASIWLYVNWRYVTKQLTTEQKELWADAVDAEERDFEMHVDRWWRPSTQEADDYGRDYDAQAHALGLPEVGVDDPEGGDHG